MSSWTLYSAPFDYFACRQHANFVHNLQCFHVSFVSITFWKMKSKYANIQDSCSAILDWFSSAYRKLYSEHCNQLCQQRKLFSFCIKKCQVCNVMRKNKPKKKKKEWDSSKFVGRIKVNWVACGWDGFMSHRYISREWSIPLTDFQHAVNWKWKCTLVCLMAETEYGFHRFLDNQNHAQS